MKLAELACTEANDACNASYVNLLTLTCIVQEVVAACPSSVMMLAGPGCLHRHTTIAHNTIVEKTKSVKNRQRPTGLHTL